jgi:hypothetical protein
MKHTLIILAFALLLVSCNQEKKLNSEFGLFSTEFVDSLKTISNPAENFELNATENNTIVAKNGTILIISPNSFVDINGNFISNVTIVIKENFEMSDFILSNLQTKHNDEILESTGMIYLSATDEKGNTLSLSPDKKIRVQIPQNKSDDNSKIFLGTRVENGTINWQNIEEPSKSLIPYPIAFLAKIAPWRCLESDIVNVYEEKFKNNKKFENTLVATKEFAERIGCDDEILEIYLNNIEKNLYEIDEMIVNHLVKDSMDYLNSWIFKKSPNPYGGPRTKAQKDAHKWMVDNSSKNYHDWINRYREFAKQKLTKVDTTKIIDTTKLKEINKAFISYDASSLGWINVDVFFNDPKSEVIELIAKTNQEVQIINLILKGRNVILNGFEKGDNEYSFTKNKEGYNKLPKGEKALITAIGYVNGILTFGKTEIILGKSKIEVLDMKEVSASELKEEIKKTVANTVYN